MRRRRRWKTRWPNGVAQQSLLLRIKRQILERKKDIGEFFQFDLRSALPDFDVLVMNAIVFYLIAPVVNADKNLKKLT